MFSVQFLMAGICLNVDVLSLRGMPSSGFNKITKSIHKSSYGICIPSHSERGAKPSSYVWDKGQEERCCEVIHGVPRSASKVFGANLKKKKKKKRSSHITLDNYNNICEHFLKRKHDKMTSVNQENILRPNVAAMGLMLEVCHSICIMLCPIKCFIILEGWQVMYC